MTPSNAHGFPFVDEKQEDTAGSNFISSIFNGNRGGATVVGPIPFAWRAANAPPHIWAQPLDNQLVGSTSRDIDPASSDTGCASGALAI
jgi:hypothetical protein